TILGTCSATQSSPALPARRSLGEAGFFRSHSGTTPLARCNSRRRTGAIHLPARASLALTKFVQSEWWFRSCHSNRSAGFETGRPADRLHKAPHYSARSSRSLLPQPQRFRLRSSILVPRAADAEFCHAVRQRAKADTARHRGRGGRALFDR